MLNPYFSQGNSNEKSLYNDLIVESIMIYGQNVYFLPRTLVSENKLLGEGDQSRFDSYHEIEAYIDTANYVSSSTVFSKFGIEIRDQIVLIMSKERWKTQIGVEIGKPRPFEGDLIYIPLLKSLYEVEFVDHENPNFYQMNDLPIYKLELELYDYNGEQLNTGLHDVDRLEYTFGSGGLTMLVEFITANPGLNHIERGKFYSQTSGQDTARAKLYSIVEEPGSPSQYRVVFGQVQGIFNVSETDELVEETTGTPVQFKIVKIYSVSDEESEDYTDEDITPNDTEAMNMTLEKEADKVRTFDENNPFGEF